MKLSKRIKIMLAASAILTCLGAGESSALGPAPYPPGAVTFPAYTPETGVVKPGEVFTFIGSWNGIEAAQATLTIQTDPKRTGYICARADGKITGSVSLLYAAEDSISACMDRSTLKPEIYTIRLRETLENYDMSVKFDHEKKLAARDKLRAGKKSGKDFNFKNAYCPVSVFLLIRSLPWKTGDQRSFEVIDGNDRYLLVVEAGAAETVTVKAGTFKALRIIPSIFELPSDGRPETAKWWDKQRRKDAERISLIKSFELWMAVDGARPFVKARADLYFGHVDLELASLKVPN